MSTERALDDLRGIDPADREGAKRIAGVLQRKSGLLIGAAADRIRDTGARGFEAQLVKAWATLMERPVQRDPGCRGKLAIVQTLDALDWHDDSVFLEGARYRQLEPSWGPPVDTAGSVRGQCAFALVRLAWPGTPSLLADLLVDPLPPVRANAARAVSAWSDPMGAAVLRLKLHAGDDDLVALCEVLAALVELDRESGLALARDWLRDGDPERREVAALALGQTRLPEVVPILLDALELTVAAEERRTLWVSLGTLRLEPARDALIARVDGPDQRWVLEALRPYRFDPTTLETALARCDASAHDALRAALDPE